MSAAYKDADKVAGDGFAFIKDEDSRARKTILVIDDDVDITEVLAAILRADGYRVEVANRAVDGLLRAMETDFDAIICDMVMPCLRGDMFFLAVSRVKPHLCERFIFISGHGDEPAIAAFLGAVQQPVLSKPLRVDDFLEVLAGVLARNDACVS